MPPPAALVTVIEKVATPPGSTVDEPGDLVIVRSAAFRVLVKVHTTAASADTSTLPASTSTVDPSSAVSMQATVAEYSPPGVDPAAASAIAWMPARMCIHWA